MQNLDSTIVTSALPQMAIALSEEPVRLSSTILAYILGFSLFVPACGWLADRIGARTSFCIAIIVFVAASIVCGLSSDLWALVAARVVQGCGAALMIPIGRSVLLQSIARSEYVGALAYLSLMGTVGTMLGPPLGGFLATYASWRWIFLINVPLGLAGLIAALVFIAKDPPAGVKAPFDWLGFVLTGTALACIVVGIDTISHAVAFTPGIVVLLGSGAVIGGFVVWRARRTAQSLLDFTLTKYATFRVNLTAGIPFRFGAGALPFLMPLLFQVGFGMTAFAAGLLILVFGAGTAAVRLVIRRVLRRYGFRTALSVGNTMAAILVLGFTVLTPETPVLLVAAFLLVLGVAQSSVYVTTNTIAYAEVAPHEMNGATSLTQLTNQLANSVGVALAALILHLSQGLRGSSEFTVGDFQYAFIAIALITLCATPFFMRLSRDAGAEVSGHNRPHR